MEVLEYINNDFKPFGKGTSIRDAQDFFEDVEFTHFPVVESNVYLGVISQDDVVFFESDKKISDYLYSLKGFFGKDKDDVITLLEIFAKNKTTLLPVLDGDKKFVGYYLIEDMIGLFTDYPFLNEYGSTLIVEKDMDNFSMAQVAQIVESNDLQPLGLMVTKMEGERVEVTIRLNHDVTDSLVQSFRRYGYEIINTVEADSYLQKLKERSDYLSKYLDI